MEERVFLIRSNGLEAFVRGSLGRSPRDRPDLFVERLQFTYVCQDWRRVVVTATPATPDLDSLNRLPRTWAGAIIRANLWQSTDWDWGS